ncbi:MAG: histidine biosynthesis bifunctional protein HisIE [Melioribacteraceae bacterium]|nr:MAG: histidine biosynthesis bifunctional protein HisIE [Melioribacteraceae bacterium]
MINIGELNFDKGDGLIPAIITDYITREVLMLGYMNKSSIEETINSGKVTFFSRSKKRLWKKGETSGNFLNLKSVTADCDNDTLLISVIPEGPVCHNGTYTCFNGEFNNLGFLNQLEEIIKQRKDTLPENSYTTKLFKSGENRIIQKVGEEAIETVIAAKNNDREEIVEETSDLIFHLMVMLAEKNISLNDITTNLRNRHKIE